MADNTLWLIHRPSGVAVQLGERLGGPWVPVWPADSLAAFLTAVFYAAGGDGPLHGQDDFALLIEDGSGAPYCNSEWDWNDDYEPILRRKSAQ